jgi:signal peptidase I
MHDARRADGRTLDDATIAAGKGHPQSRQRWAWEWTKSFLIAFGLFLIIRTFLVEAFRIPTGSMENTLLVGDFLLVNKAVFGARVPFTRARTPTLAEPARADIVVFVPPHDSDKTYVKRLIGMPGDTLEMRQGALMLNGRDVHEQYVRRDDTADAFASGMFWQCEYAPAELPADRCRPTRDTWGPVVVPAQHYFVMGDNRNDSEDSRYWGFVHRDGIRGRPLLIYYSFDPAARRAAPWLTAIRWGRIGDRVQ